ncbi:MAG: hypothetical protein DDT37_00647 [Firmicutes bacterium]|nr:hypothetical protein [candidate division NPL-UPA2 bacterium]
MKLDVRINHFHAAFAILAVTIGTVFFPVAGVVVPLAGAAGWVSVLLAFVVALPWVFMAMGLVSRGPSGDFGGGARLAGPVVRRALGGSERYGHAGGRPA